MLTYKKEVEVPRLEVRYDSGSESPRGDSNIGVFVWLGKNGINPAQDTLLSLMVSSTAKYAENVEDHARRIIAETEVHDDTITIVHAEPVHKYEHGSVNYGIGVRKGYDYSNAGFYLVLESNLTELGIEDKSVENLQHLISEELELYSSWANGEVYRYTLLDEQGEEEDSCGGFYDLESMKEYLPEEFKDEDLQDYFKSNADY